MQRERPYALTIAGFDTCGGAGLNADLKTFEQLHVQGLSVCTALTLQTENFFHSIEWRDMAKVKEEILVLLRSYKIAAVKTGILPGMDALGVVVNTIHEFDRNIKIVVDPVWKSGTGHTFTKSLEFGDDLLSRVTLVTPNIPEAALMGNGGPGFEHAKSLTAILLKGGHSDKPGTDRLYSNGDVATLDAGAEKVHAKHGTGCVLSAAITAWLARGADLKTSCSRAKEYVERFMASTDKLLGYHAS